MLVAFLSCVAAVPALAQDIGTPAFLDAPEWQQGQYWVMDVSHYQQQTTGDPYWTPQVQYRYEVIGQEQVQGVPCLAVQVKREGALEWQQKMYYHQQSKQLVKVDTKIQVGGEQQVAEQWMWQPGSRDANPAEAPLSIVPCALPAFSPPAGSRSATPPQERKFKVKFSKMPGKSGVVQEFTQEIRKVDQARVRRAFEYAGSRAAPEDLEGELYEVSITDSWGKKSIMRVNNKAPFPVNFETPTMRATLATWSGR
jgi:hypothetical protein